jgi:hypothetical protein
LLVSFHGLKGAVVDGDLAGKAGIGIVKIGGRFLVVLEVRLAAVLAVGHVAFDPAVGIILLGAENDVAVAAFVVDPVKVRKLVDDVFEAFVEADGAARVVDAERDRWQGAG